MEPFPVAKKEPNGNASSKAAATLAALTGPQAVDMSLARCKTLEKHEMDHWLLPQTRRLINTGMTQHEFPLVADVLADFILYPTSDELRLTPRRSTGPCQGASHRRHLFRRTPCHPRQARP